MAKLAILPLQILIIKSQAEYLQESFQGGPEGGAAIGVDLLHVCEQFAGLGAGGVVLEGAGLDLTVIPLTLRVFGDLFLVDEAEGTNDGKRHLIQRQPRCHRGEFAGEGHVHQEGLEDIVAVVAKGYFVAANLLGESEQGVASIAGAEEAMVLVAAVVVALVVGSGKMVKVNALLMAEILQVGDVRLVAGIGNGDMCGGDGDAWAENLLLCAEQLDESEGILASAECDEDVVAVLQQPVFIARLMKVP